MSSTVLYQIDVGRTSGGVVSGWGVDTGIVTSGADSGPYNPALTINTSLITNPPPNAVLQQMRYTGTTLTATFTGLSVTNTHKVELYFTPHADNGCTFNVDINTVRKASAISAGTVPGKSKMLSSNVVPDAAGQIQIVLTVVSTQAVLSAIRITKLG